MAEMKKATSKAVGVATCPACGQARERGDDGTYECTECGKVGCDCCVPGKGLCMDCEDGREFCRDH